MAGITPTGFEILRLQEIKDALAARHRQDWGAATDTSPQTALGQLDGVMAEREASLWELGEVVHGGGRLFNAVGPALDDAAALIGLTRLPATATVVDVVLAGTPAAVVPAGTQFRITGTDRIFELAVPAVIGGGGTVAAQLVATVTGPLVARAGVAWTILNPVVGLASLSNPLDGETGRDVETDTAFRERILSTFTGPGNSPDALMAALYRVAGVTEVRIIENEEAWTDADGRPPHSAEAIVVGGADQDVAEAIWAEKPAGIRPYGLTTTVVVGSDGTGHTVGLTRPADVDAWIEVDVYARAGFPADGEQLIEDQILVIEPGLRAGQAFQAWLIANAVADAVPEGLVERVEIRLGTAASPTTDNTINVTARQRVALDSTRIVVTRFNA